MKNEIQRIDEEEQQRRKFGFLTSRSANDDSDQDRDEPSDFGKENEVLLEYSRYSNGYNQSRTDKHHNLSMQSSASKTKRQSSLIKKKPLPFRSSAGFNNKNS